MVYIISRKIRANDIDLILTERFDSSTGVIINCKSLKVKNLRA